MAIEKINSIKWFLVSGLITLAVLLGACFIWTDFEASQVANLMFWVGILPVIAGGAFFIPQNKYHGSTEAAMMSLRDKLPGQGKSLKQKEAEITRKVILGSAVAAPGIILMTLSWILLYRG